MKNYLITSISAIAVCLPFIIFGQCAGTDIIHIEDFSSGTIGSWTSFNILGDDTWQFDTSYPHAYINGFGGVGPEEDWLLSPPLDLSTLTNLKMTFSYSEMFSGPDLDVLYSSDYSGIGDPNTASWTLLETLSDITDVGFFPYDVDQNIDISFIDMANVYLAFRYTAIGPTGGEAEAWKIDNICISGGAPNMMLANVGCEPITGNYYGCIEDFIADGGSCSALKTQLFSLIDDHQAFPYTSSSFDVWDFMCQYDMRFNDDATSMIMWDVYSDVPSGMEPYEYECSDRNFGTNNGQEGDNWNREHVFPQSWWGSGSSVVQRSDVNNLFPSDTYVNGEKGSHQLGEVLTASFTSLNGTKVGSSVQSCASTVFEPIDEYKGDMARMFFYMATRYEDQVAGWENNSTSSDQALSGNSYTVYEPCLLHLLIKWHNNDPVSQKELDRNEAVFVEQNNRNPFIDHPEYVHLIWGQSDGITITTPCDQVIADRCNYANDALIIESPVTKKSYRVEGQSVLEIGVPSNEMIIATAGESITINEGTCIDLGSEVHFYIEDCTMSNGQ